MIQQYAILVTAPPRSTPSRIALGFVRAALQEGHSIIRVFFMADGVECGKEGADSALQSGWQMLAESHSLDLVLCSSSAIKHGVFDEREATRREQNATIARGFNISGLGQWLDACDTADRVLRFGE